MAIPNHIKYHTPTYIHSHPTDLNSDKAIEALLVQRAHNIASNIKTHLDNVITYLKSNSVDNPTIMNFYTDTHNGHTRKMSTKGLKLINEFANFRQQLSQIKSIQDKNHTVSRINKSVNEFWSEWFKLKSEQGSTIEEALGNTIATDLVNFFKDEALRKGNKKKYSTLTIYDSVDKLLNNNKQIITKEFQRILRKYFNSYNDQKSTMEAIINTMNKEIKSYIDSFQDINYCLLDSNSINILQHKIDAFNGHNIARYSISGSGSIFEKIFNYLLLEEAAKQLQDGSYVWQVNNNPPQTITGISVANSGHGVTTDNVIKMIDQLGNELKMGFSLKANYNRKFGSTFNKTVHAKRLVNSSVTKDPVIVDVMNLFDTNTTNQLLYYLGNDQAFSVFRAPILYNTVVTGKPGNYNINYPTNVHTTRPIIYNSLTKVRNVISYIYLLKGLLGSIFGRPNFIQEITSGNYVPPIILSFVTEDYFTCEILQRLSQSIGYNYSNLSDYADTNFYVPDFNFSVESLQQLFLTKKLIASNYGNNRYDELIDNSVDSIYNGLVPYQNLTEALTVVNKDLNIKKVIHEITKPIKFKISINELIQ